MRSGPLNQRIPFATDQEQMRAIDDWRRCQPDLPSRSEAIRRLIDIALAPPPASPGVRPTTPKPRPQSQPKAERAWDQEQ